ncbi:MAG: AI-2E family transporter, partial [Firmicutes bacterium]|nr:AI-2E family transporter [Bacillota bacterium]
MRPFFKDKYIRNGIYLTALFAAVYVCKHLIDALVYAVANIGVMLNGLTLAAGRICEVFAIVLIGFLIAYILDPLVTFIQKKAHTSRLLAVSLCYFVLILLIVTAIFTFLKKIRVYDPDNTANALFLAGIQYKNQLIAFYTDLIYLIQRYDFLGLIPSLDRRFADTHFDCINAAQNIGKWFVNIILSLIIA